MFIWIFFYNFILLCLLAVSTPVWGLLVLYKKKWRGIFLDRIWLKTPEGIREKEGCIWIHGLSVGEALSAKPLVDSLSKELSIPVVFSVSTLTGYQTAKKMFQDVNIPVFFFPFDFSFSVKKALNTIKPAAVIIIENDIWPNFVWTVKKAGIPLVWANARVSDRSFTGYYTFRHIIGPLFDCFDLVLAQTSEDKKRLSGIGIYDEKIKRTGNLKFDRDYRADISENLSKKELLEIDESIKIFVAGSTHPGEEDILLEVYRRVSAEMSIIKSGIVFVIAPRDPSRAFDISELFEKNGVSTGFLGDSNRDENADIIIVDTLGRLLELYSVCDVSFIGGSLVDLGGHNPLEPASFAKPVLFGPYMNDFREIASAIVSAGGAFEVASADDLSERILDLISDSGKLVEIGKRAYEASCIEKGVAKACSNEIILILKRDYDEQD